MRQLSCDEMLSVRNVSKRFELHERGVLRPVLEDVSLSVRRGECVGLEGPSGAGKSTLMRMVYGSYRTLAGEILVRTRTGCIDIALADAWALIELRRSTIGYVSQFLRVLPRVSALDVVAAPLMDRGHVREDARCRAAAMLARLGIGATLWDLSPLTFSGGEQQRLNIARGFVAGYPVILLDEPTASLDRDNRSLVLGVVREAVRGGAAVLGIFHDREAADQIVTRRFQVPDIRN